MMYLQLFWEFFQTGLFAVGGGMATIPFLYEIADKTGWYTAGDLANMIAVGESTPGPIGVNMATYVGFITGMADHGVFTAILGAVITTLGLITPSVILILIVASILQSFRKNPLVKDAFYGLRPASTGLIAAAGFSVVLSNMLIPGAESWIQALNWKGLVLAVVLWLLTNVFKFTKKLHPILFIAFSALVGIVLQMG